MGAIEDATLLALKMEEGAMGKAKQGGKGTECLLVSPAGMQSQKP